MNATSETEHLDVDFYREKLRELRAKCGLDSNNAEVCITFQCTT